MKNLLKTRQFDGCPARAHQDSAQDAADQGVRGTAWKSKPPRCNVPQNGAEQRREDHTGINGAGLHHLVANRVGDRDPEHKRAYEICDSGCSEREARWHCPRGDDRGDHVTGIVDAVQEVESQGQDDRAQQDGGHRASASLGQLYDDISDNIGRLVATISRVAEVTIDLAQLEHHHHMGDVFGPTE